MKTRDNFGKVRIREVEYKARKTSRAFFIFEEITQRPFEIKGMLDNYLFLYCILLANNPDGVLQWDDFVDAVDEDPKIMESLHECLTMANETEKLLNGDSGEDSREEGEVKKN